MIDETETLSTGVGDPALFAKLQGWVKKGRQHWSEWRKEAISCYAFDAGDHWDDDAKRVMVETGRQPITFNRVGPIIDAICGMEVNNRQEVKYRPRTQGDAKVNDMLSSLAKWARDEAQAEDEESQAFRDAVICGLGCTETRMDYSDSDGTIVIDRVDPLEVGIDPAATKSNAVDRRYAWRVRTLPVEAAKELVPGFEVQALNAAWAAVAQTVDGGEGNKTDYPDETRSALRNEANPKEVTLVEVEWFDTVSEVMVAVQGANGLITVPRDQWDATKAQLEEAGAVYTTATQQRRVYRHAILGSSDVIEVNDREAFHFHFITGKRDRNKKMWYGVVRALRDPSMLANKVLSQIIHILNSNAKGGILYESDAFENVRDAEKDWSNPQKSIRLRPGALVAGKIKERTAPQMPPVLSQLLEYSIKSIPDVTGVNVEMLGLADRDQPAVLEASRKQSAITILAALFDGLRRYRKEQGLVLLNNLRKLTPATMVRITQDPPPMEGQQQREPAEQYVPFDPAMFNLTDDTIRYDVIVDEAPTSPSQKDAIWNTLSGMIGQGLEVPPNVMAELVKYSPLPSSLAEKISGMISGSTPDPEKDQMRQTIEQGTEMMQKLQAELEALKADRSLDERKLEIDAFKAETDRLKLAVPVVNEGVMV